jgi:hypothetical protein
MAIFIASTKSISRGNGQSAVASASYRAGVELKDKRYGKTHDYSKRHGVMSAGIILPSALADAKATIERSELWNKAEIAENRKDARVAREWLVNLPHELNEQDRKAIAHQFAQTLADRYGTIADCAIHKPTDKEIERGADPRNFHAHIMFTTRTAKLDDNNEIILTDKATIELSDTKRGKLGMKRVSHEIKEVRQIWEHIANEKLAEHNHALIDSRSYAEQGIDILPQVKMGVEATHLERRTDETSIRGEVNRLIAERNSLVWDTELTKNQKVNDAADAIILNGHRIKDIEHTTPPPTRPISGDSPKPSMAKVTDEPIKQAEQPSASKPKASRLDAVAEAMAMAQGIKTKREDEQKQKGSELEQQQQRDLAEFERVEQVQANKARQQQVQAEQVERESKQFLDIKKDMYDTAMAQAAKHKQKGIEPNSSTGKYILALVVANEMMHNLNDYIDGQATTQRQRVLAVGAREHLTEVTTDNVKHGLKEIKNLHYTNDRKTHTEALQGILKEFVGNHSKNIDQRQQSAIEMVQKDVADYSNEINRSHSYGLGR